MPRPVREFYAEVMRRKKDDHHASHSDLTNQLFHIISSSVFLGCYVLAFWDLTTAMWAGPGGPGPATGGPRDPRAALPRQGGAPARLQHPEQDAWSSGPTSSSPSSIVVAAESWTGGALGTLAAAVARDWFLWTVAVVAGRVVYLVWTHGLRLALVWLVKLVTDPITDLAAYAPRYLRRPTIRSAPAILAWAGRAAEPGARDVRRGSRGPPTRFAGCAPAAGRPARRADRRRREALLRLQGAAAGGVPGLVLPARAAARCVPEAGAARPRGSAASRSSPGRC